MMVWHGWQYPDNGEKLMCDRVPFLVYSSGALQFFMGDSFCMRMFHELRNPRSTVWQYMITQIYSVDACVVTVLGKAVIVIIFASRGFPHFLGTHNIRALSRSAR